MALEQLSVLIATAIALLVAAVYRRSKSATIDPKTDAAKRLPWVGVKDVMLSGLRGRIASMTNLLDLMKDGYKYSSNGDSFVLPGLFDPHAVIIPSSEIKWMVDQPDEVLSAGAMQRESLQADYTFLDPEMVRHPLHEKAVRKELTRTLGTLIPEIYDEVSFGIDEYWGNDTKNWKEIGVFENMTKIVSRASNRMFVGLPLCRNDEYLENCEKFAGDIPLTALVFKLFPKVLRPLFSWLILLPTKRHFNTAAKHLVPLIRQRMADYRAGISTNDFTSWHISKLEGEKESERRPETIANRLLLLNFAAIHTSTFGATGILFDVFSTPPEDRIVESLREEIQGVLSEHNGKFTKEGLAKLVKLDSAIRESMRMSPVMMKGMERMVTAPEGVTMNNGMHLPQGALMGSTVWMIHHDDRFYPNAMTYDAFRFSRAREEATTLDGKNLSIVTTSPTFLPFGHGKHACPGRFFAAAELKLMLAYIIMNYDIKPMAVRPPNSFMGPAVLPPMKETISVRRRKIVS